MVKIPESTGIQARPNTVTNNVIMPTATDTSITKAVKGLANVATDIGARKLYQNVRNEKAEALKLQKENEAYDAAKMFEFNNNMKRFDNEQRIKLDELPLNSKDIDSIKGQITKERKNYASSLKRQHKDNDRILNLLSKSEETGAINLDFTVDKAVSKAQKQYAKNQMFQTLFDLREGFEDARTEEEFIDIETRLSETMAIGINSGLLNHKDLERQEKEFAEMRKERVLELEKESNYNRVMDGKMILDPKTDKGIVDERFKKIIREEENPMQKAVEIATKTGIMPTEAKKNWSNHLRMGTAQQKIDSALAMNDLFDSKPALQDQFTSSQVAYAKAIRDRSSLGMSESQVIEYTDEELKKNKSLAREVREKSFKIDIKKQAKKIEDVLSNEYGGWFEIDPEVPQNMVSEVIQHAQDLYINEGYDIETSINAAKGNIKVNWDEGIEGTAIDNQLQKYSPYSQYPNMDKKLINKQAKKFLEDTEINIDFEKVKFTPVANTIGIGKTQYNVWFEDRNGVLNIITGTNNMAVSYKPNVTETNEYKQDNKNRDLLR